MATVLVYGANGYMGKLCAQELVEQGVRPILAGRSDTVHAVAQAFDCPAAEFDLEDEQAIVQRLDDVALVINLAGPFRKTQAPLIKACLQTNTHYMDIAGEVDEMRSAYAFDAAAREADIMLLPGAGFGVVPTDIAANVAQAQLPDASSLTILYATEGGASRGTLKTVLGDIQQPGVQRVNGEMVSARAAESSRDFTVAGKRFTAVFNPWRADLFTAGISTGIPNIQTYTVFPGFVVQMMRGRLGWLRNLILNQLIRLLPEGPSAKQLREGSTYVRVIAATADEEKSVALRGPEAYWFTAQCLVEISAEILNGNVAAGFQTPAYFGKELLDRIAGVTWE